MGWNKALSIAQPWRNKMLKYKWIIFCLVFALLSVLLFFDLINIEKYIAVLTVTFIVFFISLVEPNTIKEINLWKGSIKRDVKAAKEIKESVEKTAKNLRAVVKLVVEDTFIIASSSILAMGADQKARKRLEDNLDKLSRFVERDSMKEDKWWSELHDLFPNREHSNK